MKKIITIFTTLIMVVALAVPAFATSFTPSVQAKPAPEFVPTEAAEGVEVAEGEVIIGYVVDENDEIQDVATLGSIVVTALAECEESEVITDEAKEAIKEFYEGILNNTIKLDECEDLLAALRAALGEDKTTSELVIKDLFDVTITDAELNAELLKEGNTISLTFDANVEADAVVFVVTYKQGKIVLATDIVNNGDGTVSATFENFCPVAILVANKTATEVAPEVVEPTTPATSSNAFNPMLIIIVIIAVIVVAMIAKSKGKKEAK